MKVARYVALIVFSWLAAASAPMSFVQAAETTTPAWLWRTNKAGNTETIYFRKSFELNKKVKSALLIGACDNIFTLFVNGKHVLQHNTWQSPVRTDIAAQLQPGKNVLAVRAVNEGGAAGFIVDLTITFEDGTKQSIVTDNSWGVSGESAEGWQKIDFDDLLWAKPHVIGKLGIGPWGMEDWKAKGVAPSSPGEATPEANIKVVDGFKIERLYSVPKPMQGSWVAMTPDPKGRLIVSDQGGKLYRVTVGATEKDTKVEQIELNIGGAQGLLYAYDRLYVSVNGPGAQGNGFYAVIDNDNDDKFDEVRLLKKFQGGGEHGPHGIRLGPDGLLYIVAGNFTKIPEGSDANAPHRNWAEDLLLPRNPDGGGHDPHIMAPGGWVARTDKEGKNWQLVCAGLRNAYDIDFNLDGEIFTFDSDMEWDTGAPWYRPTRVNHCVSGAEYGWRNGTGKWPEYYIDSLGAVANIGRGSPTGVCFGTGAKFPAKYQRALFILDWTYGKIYAIHAKPSGASYTSTHEVFIEGRPLPVTDICVNNDGNLYFTIGGRGTQSGLYRVTYTGQEATSPVGAEENKTAAQARTLRRQLEEYHTRQDAKAIDLAWPHLNSVDRSLRYAARVAIEHQDPKLWQAKALAETKVTAALQAMVALIRNGDKEQLSAIVNKLNSLPLKRLSEEQLLDVCRVYGLAFIRLGKPEASLAESVKRNLNPLYPHASESVNRELCQLLAYLGEPSVVARSMELMKNSLTQEDQLFYVLALRVTTEGWTPELRRSYFGWLNLAESKYSGGNSFKRFLERIRKDAVEKLTETEKASLKDVIEEKAKFEVVKLETTRQFVHNWQIDDLQTMLADVEKGRSFTKGKAAYEAAQCFKCHRFGGNGGSTGPDITAVGSRFTPLYLLESLIVPSKVVSDQYLGSIIQTEDGEVISGRVVEETDKVLKIRTTPFATELVEVPKNKVESRQPALQSEMPQGLINVLTKEEVLDLIAYMRSAGNENDKAFQK